jgi:hypothetical protein
VVCAATDTDRIRTKRNVKMYLMVFAPLTQYYPDVESFVKIFLRKQIRDTSSRVRLKMDAGDSNIKNAAFLLF